MHPCDLCDKEFTTVYLLLQHQKYNHEKWGPTGDSAQSIKEADDKTVPNEESTVDSKNEENHIELEDEDAAVFASSDIRYR